MGALSKWRNLNAAVKELSYEEIHLGNAIEITYSRITKDVFEEFCKNNMLSLEGEVRAKYWAHVRMQRIFHFFWIMFYLFVAWEVCICKVIEVKCEGYNIFFVILAVVLWVVFCEKALKHITCKLSPQKTQVDNEENFRIYVEVYYYPLLELQEKIQHGLIKEFVYNSFARIISYECVDEDGRTRMEEVYLYRLPIKQQNGDLDFTYIDDAINEKAVEYGCCEVV